MESAGRVLIIPRGAWDAQTEYHMLDAVRYQGSMYVAKRTNTNVTPVDGADWFLSAEGAQNGGHTIKDPSGTSFTQRDGLQFTDAKVIDDGTNDTTKIEIVQTETASEFENETADGLYNVTGEDDEFFTSEDIEYRTNTSVKQALDRHESSMAFVENGDTSVGAYTAGQYIVHGDKFYEVKSTIAAGDTFTTGTNGNIEEKNIGQVITAINSNLGGLKLKIYNNVEFVFNNSQYSVINISSLDPDISNAKITLASNAQAAGFVSMGINSTRTQLQATLLDTFTGTMRFNILVIW